MKKIITLILSLTLLTLSLVACTGKPASEPEDSVPTDFQLYIRFGVYGISSYSTETGELVKTTDATKPEDYVTTLKLNEEQKKQLWAAVSDLDLSRYPAYYNPNEGEKSTPDMTLVLSVTANGVKRTVTCQNICLTFTSGNRKGQKFLDACDSIIKLLTATPEWEALPEYENLYH